MIKQKADQEIIVINRLNQRLQSQMRQAANKK